MIRILGAVVLPALLLLTACSGGGGSDDSVPAPSNLIATAENAHTCTLQWTPSPGAVDGYCLEGKVDAGSFQRLNLILFQPDSTGGTLTFKDTAPELATYTFRIRALRKGVYSAYSNESSCLRPLCEPSTPLIVPISDGTGMDLKWTITSALADTLLIERQETEEDGTVLQDWHEIARVSPSLLAYHDSTLVEERGYSYRFSNLKDDFSSQKVVSDRVFAPLIAPEELTVDPTDTGFHLTWKNRSLLAPYIKILCGSDESAYGDIVATLPASTTSYDDAAHELGYYTYRVAPSRNGTTFRSVSAPVSVMINRSGQLALTPSLVTPPSGASFAFLRQKEADWLFADLYTGIVFGNGSLPSFSILQSDWWEGPYLLFDKQGYPHGLSREPAGTTSTHFWYDGTSWLTERFQSQAFDNASYSPPGTHFSLDGDGNPHVLLDHTEESHDHGGSTATLDYAHKVDGTWTLEDLSGIDPQIDDIYHSGIYVSNSGKVHVLLQGKDWIVEGTRDAEKVWTTVNLPLGDYENSYAQPFDYFSPVWLDDDNAWLLYWSHSAAGTGFNVMRKTAGVWQEGELVAPTSSENVIPTKLVISPDRSRLAFATNTLRGLKILDHSSEGWRETLLCPQIGTSYYDWWSAIGFDAQNKLHLMTWSEQTGFVEYRE